MEAGGQKSPSQDSLPGWGKEVVDMRHARRVGVFGRSGRLPVLGGGQRTRSPRDRAIGLHAGGLLLEPGARNQAARQDRHGDQSHDQRELPGENRSAEVFGHLLPRN